MQRLELTLATAEENLALDEALLEEAETGGSGELLRIWEPHAPLVVIGRSTRLADEVHETACHERGIPICRRASGGAAVVVGPGCLMYALVLDQQSRPFLRSIEAAHQFVLGKLAAALRPFAAGATRRGTSDLALGDLKFSGNSLRVKRNSLLYHGTLLYRFPLELIDICLGMPARQPDYRAGRPHWAFVTNLPLEREVLLRILVDAWQAHTPMADWPRARTEELARQKYSAGQWNLYGTVGR